MPETPGYQRFFAELKRRRVFRVMAVYGAVAFVILQVADISLPGLGLPEWTITLILALTVLGFPIAVVLAWAFETTADGVRRTVKAQPGEIAEIVTAPASTRWPSGLLALCGVLALVAGAWWVGRSTAPAAAGGDSEVRGPRESEVLQLAYADLSDDVRPSLAVLPFADMSAEGDQAYFADGMSEELLNALAKVRALRVAGRTSSFAYRNVEKDLREIGSELGVRYVVEGSVRKQGDRLRITAQLVDASDNFHLWSDVYDRTLDDVFAVQEEIAGAIAGQLQVSLGLDDGGALVAPAADLDAYDMYLTARARMRERGAGALEAVTLFEAVVARDSAWAPGWAGLAQAYSLVPFYVAGASAEDIDPDVWGAAFEASERAAKRALALDPRAVAARVALGSVYRDRWEWKEAEAEFLQALEIDPDDVEAHQQYAELLASVGRLDEALRSARRAVALDPTASIRLNTVGWILYDNARLEESIPQLELAILRGPGLLIPYSNLTRSQLALGHVDEAERIWREQYLARMEVDERERERLDRNAAARFAALRAGDRDAYTACCRTLREPADWMLLGDTIGAIESLRNGFRNHPRYNATELTVLWQPEFDPIRHDPRFREAVKEVLAYAGLEGAVLRRAPDAE